MKDDVSKIPVRVTLFSGFSFLIYSVVQVLVVSAGIQYIAEKSVVIRILISITTAVRCPLIALITFSTNKKAKQGGEVQTMPRQLVPRNATV